MNELNLNNLIDELKDSGATDEESGDLSLLSKKSFELIFF